MSPSQINYEAAWDVYYTLADRRRRSGLTFDQLVQVINAAIPPQIISKH